MLDRIEEHPFAMLLNEADDPIDARVLDAAAGLIGDRGERNVTMSHIVLQSGVSRATIFRRFGTKSAVVNRVILRELRKFVVELLQTIEVSAGPAVALADLLSQAVRFSRVNPAFRRLVADDPQQLVDFSRSQELPAMDLARALVASIIAETDRSARSPMDNVDLADLVCHLAIAYALVPDSSMDVAGTDELRESFLALIGPAFEGRRKSRN